MTPADTPGAPLDVPTLDVMARRAVSHAYVDEWVFHPDRLSPRRLVLRIDAGRYPTEVTAVRIDLGWFENGDYTVHYREARATDTWECRWDRHPKPGGPETHFHPPPDAAAAVEPSSLDADHHLGVLFDVLDWVEDRALALHEE